MTQDLITGASSSMQL